MAILHVTGGPAKGQSFALDQHNLMMIGRDAACTFQIIDPELSRTHMQVKFVPGEDRHYAIDFKSKNGVWINEIKVDGERPLSDGDSIKLGDTTIVYCVDDAVDAQHAGRIAKLYGQGRNQTMTAGD